MIPGDLLSAFPHRQLHTLPGLVDSWAALPNSNPNACMPMQGGSLYHFYDGLWYGMKDPRRPVPKPTRPLSILPTRPLFLPWVLTNPSPKSIKSKSVISCCCVGIYFNNFCTQTRQISQLKITDVIFPSCELFYLQSFEVSTIDICG